MRFFSSASAAEHKGGHLATGRATIKLPLSAPPPASSGTSCNRRNGTSASCRITASLPIQFSTGMSGKQLLYEGCALARGPITEPCQRLDDLPRIDIARHLHAASTSS